MNNQPISRTSCVANQPAAGQQINRPAQPTAGATRQIATQLNATQYSAPNTQWDLAGIQKFLYAMNIVISKYMPVPEHVCALFVMLPNHSNPVMKIDEARNINDLIKSVGSLVDTLGLGNDGKTDESHAISGFQDTNAPKLLIEKIARALRTNNFLSAPVNARQAKNLFIAYEDLCRSILQYNNPTKIIDSLHKTDALTFLQSLGSLRQNNASPETPADKVCHMLGMSILKNDLDQFREFPDSLKNDRIFVRESIFLYGEGALGYASNELQNDPLFQKFAGYRSRELNLRTPEDTEDINNIEIVRAATSTWMKFALRYAGDAVTNNPDHMLRLIKELKDGFEYAGQELKANRDFVMESVRLDPTTIRYVNNEFKNDREVVKIAITKQGRLLETASEQLRGDSEIVLMAIRSTPTALQFASRELKGNTEIVLEAVKRNGCAIAFATPKLKRNNTIIHAALSRNGDAIKYLNARKAQEPWIILKALETFPAALSYADENQKNDINFITEVINKNINAYFYAGIWLQRVYQPVAQTLLANGQPEFTRYQLIRREVPPRFQNNAYDFF